MVFLEGATPVGESGRLQPGTFPREYSPSRGHAATNTTVEACIAFKY